MRQHAQATVKRHIECVVAGATLAYTARRAGAVEKLRLGDFQHDRRQYLLAFQEKGGKSQESPVRHHLEGFILDYVDAAGIADEAKDSPLFPASSGRSRTLTLKPLGTERIRELVKRRLKNAGRLSPYSFRVTAIISLLDQGGADGGRAVPGRACGAANDGALRPAEEAGDAEHRRTDSDLNHGRRPIDKDEQTDELRPLVSYHRFRRTCVRGRLRFLCVRTLESKGSGSWMANEPKLAYVMDSTSCAAVFSVVAAFASLGFGLWTYQHPFPSTDPAYVAHLKYF